MSHKEVEPKASDTPMPPPHRLEINRNVSRIQQTYFAASERNGGFLTKAQQERMESDLLKAERGEEALIVWPNPKSYKGPGFD